MKTRALAVLVLLFLFYGCATLPRQPLDLTSTDPHGAFICEGLQTSSGLMGTRKVKAQALIYPNADLKSIEVALTGQIHMRTPCVGDAVCQIDRSGSRIHINIKPSSGVRSDPGYSESLSFDQSTGELQFSGGGMDGGWGFVGKCESKQGLR